ncbi:MAG: ATP-dependent protease ATPase subunit HslU [Planctomycetes bacterium]|nr:ATP-dependent protease ATPase subunit HslU [Planctomycetota bacterium]
MDFTWTPTRIVAELDRHIVGQHDAKRAVAIAVRNRWRRQQLPEPMRLEVTPKNILMIGPTGVGKTEIARRLARMTGAPFLKVEASKYTEVGYYGRDVESMIRDLVENAVNLVRQRERASVETEARERAETRLLDLLGPPPPIDDDEETDSRAGRERAREKMRAMLAAGELEDRRVELAIEQKATPLMVGGVGVEQMDVDLQGMLEKILPRNTVRRELTVREARDFLFNQECDALLDPAKIHGQAVALTENSGIVFIDEIDKVVASESRGADVSRQGVQRDLLPIVEGTAVNTRYGHVRTDYILFIAAGAFHRNRPSDLMPELQGRFPIRVELKDLDQDDFVRILREPSSSLTRQYAALIGTENVQIEFASDGIESIAAFAFRVNQTTQNIGARRLATILERLLDEISFQAPERKGQTYLIDADYVQRRLQTFVDDQDLSRFIL